VALLGRRLGGEGEGDAWSIRLRIYFSFGGRGMTVRCEAEVTPHQQREAIKRRDEGDETVREIARSYNVSQSTISRIAT
jgi:hypothetical protein